MLTCNTKGVLTPFVFIPSQSHALISPADFHQTAVSPFQKAIFFLLEMRCKNFPCLFRLLLNNSWGIMYYRLVQKQLLGFYLDISFKQPRLIPSGIFRKMNKTVR